jgi:hypothetical protein
MSKNKNKEIKNLNVIKRRSLVITDLTKWCHLADKDDFAEISEWSNGEGVDIILTNYRQISMTWGEFKVISKLVKKLYNLPYD